MDPPPSDSSADLARRAKQGDREALGALLERHLPALRAFLRLQGGAAFRSKESTSDLAQSVCRDILERADDFRFGDEKGFRTWLLTTARRKLADRHEYYRAGKRDLAREAEPSKAPQELLQEFYRTSLTPSRHALAREQIELIEEKFSELPPDQQQVILLVKILGQPASQAAEQLQRSEAATRTLLSRALSRLAELIHP